MRLFALTLVLVLPMVTACGGGSVPAPSNIAQIQPEEIVQHQVESRVSSDSASDHLLYVGNTGNNSITVYPHTAVGNELPKYVILGKRTGISSPGQLSADAQGNLYVANGASVLVFAHGAHGNVPPLRTLSGPNTGIHSIAALTVDQTTGKIFVFDNVPGSAGVGRLLRFPPNAAGNEAPFAASPDTLDPAIEIVSDSTNNNLLEAHTVRCCETLDRGIDIVQKQFANNTVPQWENAIYAFWARGIADDPQTRTYLASSDRIYRFAENTVSNTYPPVFKPAPVSIINDSCAGQLAVAPGVSAPTYAVHPGGFGLGPCTAASVYVYSNTASGNAAPLRILSGPATGLSKPYGIYEGI